MCKKNLNKKNWERLRENGNQNLRKRLNHLIKNAFSGIKEKTVVATKKSKRASRVIVKIIKIVKKEVPLIARNREQDLIREKIKHLINV